MNEPRKWHVTVGKGLNNIGDKMGGILDSINAITHPNASGDSTLPDKCTPSIQTIQKNEDLSSDDFGDLMLLLTDNYEISSVYLAIGNPEQRTVYIQKQLKRYHKKM